MNKKELLCLLKDTLKKSNWQDEDYHFGHNIEVPLKEWADHFTKLTKFGCEIKIVSEYEAKISLPSKSGSRKEQALLYLYTQVPAPSMASQKGNMLSIEWHF